MKRLRAVILILSVGLLSAGAAGQDLTPRAPGAAASEVELTKWLSTGGMSAVLLVVLWSYRRDWQQRLEEKQQQIAEWEQLRQAESERADRILASLDRATAAFSIHTEAARVQSEAFQKMSRAVETSEQAFRTLLVERA